MQKNPAANIVLAKAGANTQAIRISSVPAFANTFPLAAINETMKFNRILLGILIFVPGVAIQLSPNFVFTLAFTVFLTLSFFASIGVVIIGLFSKKIKLAYLIGFFSMTFAYLFAILYQQLQFNKVSVIQQEMERFKKVNGVYPSRLDKLTSGDHSIIYVYGTLDNQQEYEMEYFINGGLNKMSFDSKARKWVQMDGDE